MTEGHSVPLTALGGGILLACFLAFNSGSQVRFYFYCNCIQLFVFIDFCGCGQILETALPGNLAI